MARAGSIRAGGAYVDIGADAAPLEQALGRAKTSVSAFTSSISKQLLAVGGIAGLGYFIKQSISAAYAADITGKKFNVVFKGITKETEAWVKKTSSAFGVGENSIKSYMNTFQDFLVPLGFSRRDAAELDKVLVRLGMDLRSWSGGDLADIFSDMQSGLMGMAIPMRKYDITLSEAAVKNELARLGMAKTNGELSEGMKLYGRIAVMMKQSTDARGYASTYMESYGKAVMRLSEAWTDLKEEIGAPLMKLLAPIIDKVGNVIRKMKEFVAANPAIISGLAKIASYATAFLLAISQWSGFSLLALFANLSTGEKKVKDVIVSLGNSIENGFGDSLGKLYDKVSVIVEAMSDLAFAAIDAVGASMIVMFNKVLDFMKSTVMTRANDSFYGFFQGPLQWMAEKMDEAAGSGGFGGQYGYDSAGVSTAMSDLLQKILPKPAYGVPGDDTPSSYTTQAQKDAAAKWAYATQKVKDVLGLIGFTKTPEPKPEPPPGLPKGIQIPGMATADPGKIGTPSGGVIGFLGSRIVGEMLGIGKGDIQAKQLTALEAIKENTKGLKDGGMAVYA